MFKWIINWLSSFFLKLKKKYIQEKTTTMERLTEEYWDNKWPKSPIIYNGRTLKKSTDRIGVDVKDFITDNDEVLKKVITKYNLKKENNDDTALAIQKFVVSNLTYKYDDDTSDVPEFWQFPFESLYSKSGDCEDGAILIASLCVNADIPEWRLKVAAGYVQPEPTAPQGGHGYCLYLADDAEWRILDWCYYEDSKIPVKDKPLAKNGGQKKSYKDIWFTFNNKYSWNQTSLMLGNRVAEDKTNNEVAAFESVENNFSNLDYI